jgi:hypothetical protein
MMYYNKHAQAKSTETPQNRLYLNGHR